MIKYLFLSLVLFSAPLFAKPLPDVEGNHFIAVSDCGSAVAFIWYDEKNMVIVPVDRIKSKAVIKKVLEARDEAAEQDNAYVVRIGANECPRT